MASSCFVQAVRCSSWITLFPSDKWSCHCYGWARGVVTCQSTEAVTSISSFLELHACAVRTWKLGAFFFYVHVSGSHCLCVWVLPVEYRLDYSGDPGLLLVPTSTWTRIRSVNASVCSPVAHCSHFESGQYFCDVHVLGSCVMMEGILPFLAAFFGPQVRG